MLRSWRKSKNQDFRICSLRLIIYNTPSLQPSLNEKIRKRKVEILKEGLKLRQWNFLDSKYGRGDTSSLKGLLKYWFLVKCANFKKKFLDNFSVRKSFISEISEVKDSFTHKVIRGYFQAHKVIRRYFQIHNWKNAKRIWLYMG